MISIRSLSLAISHSLAGRRKAEIAQRDHMAEKHARDAVLKAAAAKVAQERAEALRAEREAAHEASERQRLAALEWEEQRILRDPVAVEKRERQKQTDSAWREEQARRRIEAEDADGSRAAARLAREQELEDQRLALMSAQIARRT